MNVSNLKRELSSVISVLNQVKFTTSSMFFLWIMLQMKIQLSQMTNMVKCEQTKKNIRVRKKCSDDEENILSSDDEEQKQAQRWVVMFICS